MRSSSSSGGHHRRARGPSPKTSVFFPSPSGNYDFLVGEEVDGIYLRVEYAKEGILSAGEWKVSGWASDPDVDPDVPRINPPPELPCGSSAGCEDASHVTVLCAPVYCLDGIVKILRREDAGNRAEHLLFGDLHVSRDIEDRGTDVKTVRVLS